MNQPDQTSRKAAPEDLPNLPSGERADALIQQLDQELVIKRAARQMRRKNSTIWRLLLIVVLAAILLFAAYALIILDRVSQRPQPTPAVELSR